MYTGQNLEDKFVWEFFESSAGTLLEIGANNGETLSNSKFLISRGWKAALVEPSPQVFPKLLNLYKHNSHVFCYQVAIGDKVDSVTLYDSGSLLNNGDRALVSSLKKEETDRWKNISMPFVEVEVDMVTFDAFLRESAYKQFDFISIDAEGMDLIILKQMDLIKMDCSCLCIEHNSRKEILEAIVDYTYPMGFERLTINAENIILVRR